MGIERTGDPEDQDGYGESSHLDDCGDPLAGEKGTANSRGIPSTGDPFVDLVVNDQLDQTAANLGSRDDALILFAENVLRQLDFSDGEEETPEFPEDDA